LRSPELTVNVIARSHLLPFRITNKCQLGIGLDTKYQDVGLGIALGNGHIDMDMLYQDVSTFRACIEHYHFKPGTDKFHAYYEALS
jgi:hypothetical protein